MAFNFTSQFGGVPLLGIGIDNEGVGVKARAPGGVRGKKRLTAPGQWGGVGGGGGGEQEKLAAPKQGWGEWPPAPSPSPPMQHGVASGLGYILILKFVVPLSEMPLYTFQLP